MPLIVLPKSCSCRWGPPCLSSSPIPRLASLFYFFPLRAGAPIVGLAVFHVVLVPPCAPVRPCRLRPVARCPPRPLWQEEDHRATALQGSGVTFSAPAATAVSALHVASIVAAKATRVSRPTAESTPTSARSARAGTATGAAPTGTDTRPIGRAAGTGSESETRTVRTSSAGRLRRQESAGWDVIGKRASTLEIAAAAGTTATASLSLARPLA